MINIHFFGCSFTAGDELIDDEIFSWKHECKDFTEYFSRRGRVLPADYQERNKKLAYPALVKTQNIETFNHASNGASVQENMIKLLELVSSGSKVDCVYFQITPYGRELVIDQNNSVTSLQLAWDTLGFENYLKSKRMSHKFWQYAVEDFMDIIMIHNYLSNKGIKHKFVELASWINEFRKKDLEHTKFSYLIKEYNKLPILNLSDSIKHFPTLLGNHFSKDAHVEIARLIINDLSQNNIL
jgi:hypothetical protein